MCFRIIHFILISTVHALFLTVFRFLFMECKQEEKYCSSGAFQVAPVSYYIRLFLKPFLYFNILSITRQLLKWRHLFPWQIKTRPIYGMETGWKRIKNPEMAGFKISWFWSSTNHTTSK